MLTTKTSSIDILYPICPYCTVQVRAARRKKKSDTKTAYANVYHVGVKLKEYTTLSPLKHNLSKCLKQTICIMKMFMLQENPIQPTSRMQLPGKR